MSSSDVAGRAVRRPPLDPELAALLARFPQLARPVTADGIPGLRAVQRRAGITTTDQDLRGAGVTVAERTVPGGEPGIELSLLVLSPRSGGEPRPGVLYLHGGGMVAGDHRTGLGQVLHWVQELDLVVASLDYRLAPEHTHPAPVEDCYSALIWLREHADELGVSDWLVAGPSAGGGLAAGVALLARDRRGPEIAGLMLLGPMLDDRNETASSHELHGDAPWDRESNLTGWQALLGDARGGPDVPAYAAPARAEDLSGLPPTYLDVGAAETFRDEVITFGQRLAAAGTSVEMHVWAGAFHGFDVLASDSRVAHAARRARTDYLQRALRPLRTEVRGS